MKKKGFGSIDLDYGLVVSKNMNRMIIVLHIFGKCDGITSIK